MSTSLYTSNLPNSNGMAQPTNLRQQANALYNINEAAKACGLSPSVLRIWELRYGWPSPRRRANGYRSYSAHQVEELSRMASLVKAGTPISSLISDGLPKWPANPAAAQRSRVLDQMRSLQVSSGAAADLHKQLVAAIEARHLGQIRQLLEQAAWQIRPRDEVSASLGTVLVGLAELAEHQRPLPASDEAALRGWVLARARQIAQVRQHGLTGEPIMVRPLHLQDEALAAVAALALQHRGVHAQVLSANDAVPSTGNLLLVRDHGSDAEATCGGLGNRCLGVVASIRMGDAVSLGQIVDTQHPLPWSSTDAA